MAKKRVLWWGRFDPGYSRNRVYISLFKKLGWEVDFFFVKLSPRFGDVEAFFRGLQFREKPDLVWVPVARQRDVLAACRWARRRSIPVIFDPMISAWDKKVLEQLKWKAEERRAEKLLAREKKMMAAPDLVCWDTSCHVDFCAEYLDVPREKLRVLLTGTDEQVFKPVEEEPRANPEGPFKVLYHGAYLPLHGTEYIVEAARMTQEEGIEWSFLGWGAYKAETEAKAAGIKNIKFLDKVPYVDVPKVIAAHDVVLGVFGTTAKAARVIGNKVYECMACRRPTINEFCTGYPPEAKNCKAIKFVPPGDAKAIADAVREYRADWENRESYFAAAREFFERHLSMDVIEKQLADIVGDVVV
ncbi:MAG: glycosyltransferase [Kiritimatiellae bacterium]|nr:glycosyltransferase [Kiritimatiellia bacterium]